MKVYCAANNFEPKRISDDAMRALKRYPWPGNVRELENAIQRLVIMTDGDTISLADLPPDFVQPNSRDARARFRLPAEGFSLDKELEAYESRWVKEALEQSQNAKAEAAKLLKTPYEKPKRIEQ